MSPEVASRVVALFPLGARHRPYIYELTPRELAAFQAAGRGAQLHHRGCGVRRDRQHHLVSNAADLRGAARALEIRGGC
jgi:hypothetical protein